MDTEIWKPVPSSVTQGNIFEASSWGRVRMLTKSVTHPKIGGRKPRTGSKYKAGNSFRYILNTRRGCYIVARLVCAAFHGLPPFEDAKCLHIDENGANNRPENLKWGTQKENLNAPGFIADRKAHVGENSMWAIHKARKEASL